MALHKTCTKLATAAALGHLVIANRTPANIDVLAEDYPFYLDDTSFESFLKTWRRLQDAVEEGADSEVLTKAQSMLQSVRQTTSPEACADRLNAAVLLAAESARAGQ